MNRQPFDCWPLGRGFERFYGFLGGDTSQWHPELVYDNHRVEPPRTPEQGYHMTEDLAGKAIQFIADAKQVAPHKPFYLHFCTGAGHAPHHVAKEWADRYAGQFDDGWDAYRERTLARQRELGVMPADAELSRHDPDVPEWDSLSPDARELAARMMEVFAGFLSHTDHHIGRLVDFLKETGQFDNTLIMVVSDNGASAEGGPTGTTNELQFFNNAPESLADSLAKIDGSTTERLMTERPQIAEPRAQYIYRPHTETVPFWVGPRVLNRPHSITADVEIPDSGAEGVLICQGSNAGGWAFYVQDGRLHYAHNYVSRDTYRVSGPDPLPAGQHRIRFEFEPTGKPDFPHGKGASGLAQLYVDGQLIASTDFPVTTPIAFNPGGLTCGANPGSAVVPAYQAPFPFTGTLHTVTVDLSGDLITDSESEMRMAMARQ